MFPLRMSMHFLFPKIFDGLMLIVPPAEKLKIIGLVAATQCEWNDMIDLKVPT